MNNQRASISARLIDFARKFLPNLTEVIEQLVCLTSKDVANKNTEELWRPEQGHAFVEIKQLFSSAPLLQSPNFSKYIVVRVDASESGAGAFLA